VGKLGRFVKAQSGYNVSLRYVEKNSENRQRIPYLTFFSGLVEVMFQTDRGQADAEGNTFFIYRTRHNISGISESGVTIPVPPSLAGPSTAL